MRTSSDITARLGGLAAVLGGVLWSAKALYDRNDSPPWPTDITDTLFFVVLFLFLAGLTGLYASCRGRLREWEPLSFVTFIVGVIGLIGSIVGQLTMVFEVGPSWWYEISWWMFVFGFFVLNLSLLFLGNAVIQSRALPRWRVLPVVIGVLGNFLILIGDPPNSSLGVYPSLALWMIYGLAWTALGYVLWTYRDEPLRQTAPVR